MSELDNINTYRKKLMESLGDKDKEYLVLMKLWFKMKMTKEEFNIEAKKFLSPEQMHFHNQLLLHLLNKCISLASPPTTNSKSNGTRRKYTHYQTDFEPLDPTMYIVTEREDVQGETPQFIKFDRLLPDHSFMLARLMYGAWELGLEGATSSTAELLLIATHHFLRNMLTAIVCRRKGYKHDRKFVHAVGTPIPNAWRRHPIKQSPPFHSLKRSASADSILIPNERPDYDQVEREHAYKLATMDCSVDKILPISLVDLIGTMKMYPGLVASNFIYTVNMERILAKMTHPSWDD